MHDDELLSGELHDSDQLLRAHPARKSVRGHITGYRSRFVRIGWSVFATTLIAAFLTVPAFLASAGTTTSNLNWSAPVAVNTTYPFSYFGIAGTDVADVSCTGISSTPMCIGVGANGVFASSNAADSSASEWTMTPSILISQNATGYSLDATTCATDGTSPFCIAGGLYGYGNTPVVISSNNPTSGPGAWAKFAPTASLFTGGAGTLSGNINDVACAPNGGLCAVNELIYNSSGLSKVTSDEVVVTTNPGAASPTWSATPVSSNTGLTSITCPSATECVGVDSLGNVFVGTGLGGNLSWSPTSLDPSGGGFNALACVSTSLCVTADNTGDIFAFNPAISPLTAISHFATSQTSGFSSLVCPSTSFCAGVFNDGKLYTSANPGGAAATWTVTSSLSGLTQISCPSATLCVAVDGIGDIFTSNNLGSSTPIWSTRATSSGGAQPLSVDCLSTTFCLVGTSNGGMWTSTDPGTAPPTWQLVDVPLIGASAFVNVSCPSSSFCAAVDYLGNVFTSTNPSGGASAWSSVSIDPSGLFASISCPTASFCAAVDDSGHVFTSTNPSGGASAWSSASIDASISNQLSSISCPSASFCAAVDYLGNVFTSTSPSGGASAWSSASIDPNSGFIAITCPSASFCAAIDYSGHLFTSTNPSGGASAWSSVSIDTSGQLSSISCPSASFCAAGDYVGNVFTSTSPSGGASAWSQTSIDASSGFLAITCPSASFCAGIDYSGNVLTSNDPSGGAAAWSSTAIDANSGLSSISCSSASFCSAVDDHGNVVTALPIQSIVFTSTNPSPATVGATYTPAATGGASGNPVTFTIDAHSTSGACTIASGVVSFTGPGTCIIDANQAPSTNYSAASQVQQSVTVLPPALIAQSPLSITTLSGQVGTALTLATSGGSGAGQVTYAVTNGTAANCAIVTDSLTASSPGTCIVTATKAADTTYLMVSSSPTNITLTAKALPAKPATVTVPFVAESSALSAGAKRSLLALSTKLVAGGSVTIVGFARNNAKLAKSRASAVARYLRGRVNIHESLKTVTKTGVNRVTVTTTKQ